jgi:hypothetical protein
MSGIQQDRASDERAEDGTVAYLGLSVERVAQAVIARMNDVEAAHQRHLAALEDEAARRIELVTAQAELDAELIRLQARREAHGIVATAEARTGREPALHDGMRLDLISESVTRFAETTAISSLRHS